MRLNDRLAVLVTVLLLTGCSSAPAPEIAVHASERYLEKLAGSWSGNYWSATTGRRGRITFELEQSDGAAHGEVIMIPANRQQFEPAYEAHDLRASPRPLHIEIIRAKDNQVTGTLEPYRDPDCDCLLSTSFIGTIRGDEIEGEFVSLGGPGHIKQTGRWKIERQSEP